MALGVDNEKYTVTASLENKSKLKGNLWGCFFFLTISNIFSTIGHVQKRDEF